MKNIALYFSLILSLGLLWVHAAVAEVKPKEVKPKDAVKELADLIKKHTIPLSLGGSALDVVGLCKESNPSKPTLRKDKGKYCEDPFFGVFTWIVCDAELKELNKIASGSLKYPKQHTPDDIKIIQENADSFIKLNENFLKSHCATGIRGKIKLISEEPVSRLKSIFIESFKDKDRSPYKDAICNQKNRDFYIKYCQ